MLWLRGRRRCYKLYHENGKFRVSAAIEFLADRAGIRLPENGTVTKNGVNRIRIKEMNREAAKFFHEQLLRSPGAMAYLTERGLSSAAVKDSDSDFPLMSHVRFTAICGIAATMIMSWLQDFCAASAKDRENRMIIFVGV